MLTLMKRPLILFSLSLIGFSLAHASGCAVPIKNIEFCRDKGKMGATCAYWLNAKETKRNVPLSKWNKERLGMVCTSEEGMGNVNAIIEKLCQNSKCVEKIKELIKALE